MNAEELIVDVDPGPRDSGALPDGTELWISESNPGGNGLIEQIVGVHAIAHVKVQGATAPDGVFPKDAFRSDLENATMTCPSGRLGPSEGARAARAGR